MTEKRYFVTGYSVWDSYNNNKRVDTRSKPICDLLNEQEGLINELYEFRLMYNAHLFNEWYKNGTFEVYKSLKHNDGELCFDGEWFIVVAILPTGQITNHYHIDNWDLFKIPSVEKVKHEFDNHTPKDVLDRLMRLIE